MSEEILHKFIGKEFESVEINEDVVRFTLDDQNCIILHHCQDCCEYVFLDDVCGNIEDLENSPILMAHVSSECEHLEMNKEWTFYKFATIKGYVTFTWKGESKGPYSLGISINYIGKIWEKANLQKIK